jgi:outer membrane protein
MTLAALLARARQSEPAYLAAQADVAVAEAREDQAFGALLPQVSMTGNVNANNRNYHTRSASIPEERDRYNSNSAQISLTQPLWRYANVVGWRQAKSVVEQARQQLSGAGQELFARLAGAWFDLLAARDALVFSEQQLSARQRELETVERGEALGENSLPQLEEARSQREQAHADVRMAEAELQYRRAALEQITGRLEAFEMPELRTEAEWANLAEARLEDWLDKVESGNPALLAARHAYEAAAAEVGKQRAHHSPTLDLVASYSKNSQEVGGFPGQYGYDIKQGSVGLQLTVPLYSGGTQSAKVAEAVAQREKARLEMETARRAAELAARQAWFLWQGGAARARAGDQMILSARAALAQARKGENLGLNTRLETLQAEQQLRAGEREYRKARYDQLVSHIRLKAAIGVLTAGDVAALDMLLAPASQTVSEENTAR